MSFDRFGGLRYADLSKMNSRRWKSACLLAGTAIAAGLVAAQAQQAFPSSGRKIEFSDPGGSTLTSNLNSIATGKAAFPSFGDDLRRSADMLQTGGSLQGIGGPLIQRAPPAVSSKKLKELMEKRHDWQFLEFEDYQSEQTIEEMLGISEYGPGGELKEKKSPLERYYERLDRAHGPATNRTRDDTSFSLDFGLGKERDGGLKDGGFRSQGNSGEGLAEAEDPLKQLLRGNTGNPLFPDQHKSAGFSPVFAQPKSWQPETPENTKAQAARLEEFKRIWDAHGQPALSTASSISGITPFDPLKTTASSTPAFALPMNPESATVSPVPAVTPSGIGRDSLSPLTPAAGLAARPFELPGASPSLPALTPATPLPEPARTVTPASDFSIPKRRFP